MRRGEIWIGNLNPNRGAELNRARLADGPLTVLSAEEMAKVEKSLAAVLGLL